jgi:hypothetical protein
VKLGLMKRFVLQGVLRTILGLSVALGAGTACDLSQGKVGQGQLYLSGEARFDAYFKDVHAIQVWAAEWPDDRKATRRPLISMLDLTPDAADVTIVQATHEKVALLMRGGAIKLETFVDEARVSTSGNAKSDPGLFRAIEETANGELQRARKLNAMLPKLNELAKLGHSLEVRVDETFQKQVPGKVSEVRSELGASFTVLSATSTRARRVMRECDDFVSDLQRAVGTPDGNGRREGEKADRGDRGDKGDRAEKRIKRIKRIKRTRSIGRRSRRPTSPSPGPSPRRPPSPRPP